MQEESNFPRTTREKLESFAQSISASIRHLFPKAEINDIGKFRNCVHLHLKGTPILPSNMKDNHGDRTTNLQSVDAASDASADSKLGVRSDRAQKSRKRGKYRCRICREFKFECICKITHFDKSVCTPDWVRASTSRKDKTLAVSDEGQAEIEKTKGEKDDHISKSDLKPQAETELEPTLKKMRRKKSMNKFERLSNLTSGTQKKAENISAKPNLNEKSQRIEMGANVDSHSSNPRFEGSPEAFPSPSLQQQQQEVPNPEAAYEMADLEFNNEIVVNLEGTVADASNRMEMEVSANRQQQVRKSCTAMNNHVYLNMG